MTFSWQRLAAYGVALALLAQCAPAQDNEEKYAKKKAEDWFVKGGWSDDYDAVRATAKKEGKLILAYFTRSFAF